MAAGGRKSPEYLERERLRKAAYNKRKREQKSLAKIGTKQAVKVPASNPAKKQSRQRKRSGASCIDMAAKVLAKSRQPLDCKTMIDRMTAAKLWKPGKGKTPHNTLWARILDEIKRMGRKSRFRKAGPGLFTLAK